MFRQKLLIRAGWMLVILLVLTACGVSPSPPETVAPATTLPPEATATVLEEITPEPSPTEIPLPTATQPLPPPPAATSTLQPAAGETSVTVRQTTSGPFYVMQAGSPVWLPNMFHYESGCNWLGVAGQVFGLDGQPATSLLVEVQGTLEGQPIYALTLTGVAPDYGPAGYELVLSDHVIESSDALWLQLKSIEGQNISGQVYFNTYADCGKNLALINFVQVSEASWESEYFIPLIIRNPMPPSPTPVP